MATLTLGCGATTLNITTFSMMTVSIMLRHSIIVKFSFMLIVVLVFISSVVTLSIFDKLSVALFSFVILSLAR